MTLTPEEQAFRDLLQDRERYPAWAAETRARWERTPQGRAALAKRDGEEKPKQRAA